VATSVPCRLSVHTTAERPAREADVRTSSPAHCRVALIDPPACSPADIWKRAIADGAPADAVARLMLRAPQRRPGDPPPDQDVDSLTRGTWTFSIDTDDGSKGFHRRYPDDCGLPPPPPLPPARERALLALAKPLAACYRKAAGEHASVEAFDLRWELTVDDKGRLTHIAMHHGVDIEGLFQGSLGSVRDQFTRCAAQAMKDTRLPGEPGTLRVWGRLARNGDLGFSSSPPPP
jgi:hypothetical protein